MELQSTNMKRGGKMTIEKSPNQSPHYTRFLPFGLEHHSLKSREFERRSKKSFRKWLRRKIKQEVASD